jgi:hypothetical protein
VSARPSRPTTADAYAREARRLGIADVDACVRWRAARAVPLEQVAAELAWVLADEAADAQAEREAELRAHVHARAWMRERLEWEQYEVAPDGSPLKDWS